MAEVTRIPAIEAPPRREQPAVAQPGARLVRGGDIRLTIFTLFGNQFLVALHDRADQARPALTDNQMALIFGGAAGFVLAFASLLVSPARRTSTVGALIIGVGLLILGVCNFGSAHGRRPPARCSSCASIGGVGGAGNGPATFSLLGGYCFRRPNYPRPWPR